MHLLLIDDSRTDRLIVSKSLQAAGHVVTLAFNGHDAIEEVTRQAPDVVVTDWTLPDIDGLEVTRQIRTLDTRHYVYIVMLTGMESAESILRAFDAGVDEFLIKPFRPAEFMARLKVAARIRSLEEHWRQRVIELEGAQGRVDVAPTAGLAIRSDGGTPQR